MVMDEQEDVAQTIDPKLESVTETVIAIPFGGSDDEDDFEEEDDFEDAVPEYSFSCRMWTHPELEQRDLPDGPRLRMKAYHDAFGRCRDRIQEVLRRIHAPTLQRVIDIVRNAYKPEEDDRLMPYTELRAVAISGIDRCATAAVLEEVHNIFSRSLTNDEQVGEVEGERVMETPVIVSTITPTDCSNLTLTMKAMINGFLCSEMTEEGNDGGEEQTGQTLAPYDINMLATWYARLRQAKEESDLPKLVILVKDLEKIEPSILQDLLYICSLHIPQLPFVFILGLNTPPSPSYMHSVFPRKTLALLQLSRIEVSSGMDVLTQVLKETFFDRQFKPTIMPSPAVLSFIVDQYTRAVHSIEFVISLLQLVYLRHFTDPISVLAHDELLGTASIEEAAKKLSAPSGLPFLLALLARLSDMGEAVNTSSSLTNAVNGHGDSLATGSQRNRKSKGKRKENAINGVHTDQNSALDALKRVRKIRQRHKERLRWSRAAFYVVNETRKWLLERAKIRIGKEGAAIWSEVELMCSWFRGTVPEREGKALVKGVNDVRFHLIGSLVNELNDLPDGVFPEEDDATYLFRNWADRCHVYDCDPESDTLFEIENEVVKEMCKWLGGYIKQHTCDFTESELWDIWYTGSPTGISEIFNPAPRAAIVNALVHPERYLGNMDESESASKRSLPTKGKGKRRAGSSEDGAHTEEVMPDTALSFKGYLESGRMVNVYDWYMSFKEGLDSRRRSELRASEKGSRTRMRGKKDRQKSMKRLSSTSGSTPSSPSKGKGGGRGRGRGRGGGKPKGEPSVDLENNEGGDENRTDDDDDLSPEDRKRWKAEVQGRFIRSVQELDLLGFIKHTGRKAEHVQKTVYELPDYN